MFRRSRGARGGQDGHPSDATGKVPAPEPEAPQQPPPHARPSPAGAPAPNLVASYREAVRRAFGLIARGPDVEELDAALALEEEARLARELGTERADMIRRDVARAWWAETRTCPWCGEPGVLHDVELGGP